MGKKKGASAMTLPMGLSTPYAAFIDALRGSIISMR